ncbi:MAG: hypothetical protein LBG25_04190 [Spirochaetaceae bacterium]|jgi:hypothetical protein|nr:hypothetical protein [Spirochaetaceae bacterium]
MAQFVLFFCFWFMMVFLCTALIRFLLAWDNAARFVPVDSGTLLPQFISAAWVSLPISLYSTLLLSLSYASRRRIPAFITGLVSYILALSFTLGISLGLFRLPDSLSPGPQTGPVTLGKPGLLLSQADTVIVLLGDPAQKDGPRVVSIPGRSLIYQAVPRGPGNTILDLPPISFNQEVPFSYEDLIIDMTLAAKQLHTRLREGFVPFIAYAGALIFLLVSLYFVLNLSSWPLANLFLGALIFRGILAFESFLNSREIQEGIRSFFKNRLPEFLVSPMVFVVIGILLILFSLLSFFAWSRRAPDEN